MPYKHGVTGSSPVPPTIQEALDVLRSPYFAPSTFVFLSVIEALQGLSGFTRELGEKRPFFS